jgi:hypothetical protein
MQEIIIPRTKPAAYDTWEIRDTLAAEDLETARIPIEFPEPYLIVGCHVSVIPTTNTPELLTPTPEEILCLMDVDNQRRYTNAELIGQTSAAARGAQYVTLAALDTQYRDLWMELKSPRPVLGVSFRWKVLDDATREGMYQDIEIGIAFFCTPIKGV